MSTYVHVGQAVEDSPLRVRAYIEDLDNAAITQAGIASISYKVFDMASGTEVATGTVTVATAVFDTLQTSGWTVTDEKPGYNFKHTLPAASFPTGDARYRIEYKFTPTGGGEAFYGPLIEVPTTPVYTS